VFGFDHYAANTGVRLPPSALAIIHGDMNRTAKVQDTSQWRAIGERLAADPMGASIEVTLKLPPPVQWRPPPPSTVVHARLIKATD
jgi:hypothetical protein